MQTPEPIVIPGNRTGVLLLHGFAGTLEDLRPLASALGEQGWTVHGIWLSGHGTSEQDLAVKTSSDWLLSLRRGLLELQAVTDRIIIVGESFGGNLALHAALIGPPIIGVVTLATPVVFRNDLLTRALLPFLIRFAPLRRKRWVTDPVAHRARGSYAHVPLAAFREVIQFIDRHTKRELEGVHQPLLIFQSRKDFEVDPHSAYYLYEHAGSRHKEIVWIDERLHHVLSSRERQRWVERILHFIRQCENRHEQ